MNSQLDINTVIEIYDEKVLQLTKEVILLKAQLKQMEKAKEVTPEAPTE